jgi:hypothetical protein
MERVQEMHDSRFPEMPLEAYVAKIRMVRDEDAINRWKEESRRQVLYKLKDTPEGESAAMTRAEAEAHLQANVIPSSVHAGRRMLVPMEAALRIRDPALAATVRNAWRRERRFPGTLCSALAAAFRHKHLHMFRTDAGATCVSYARPTPLDAEHAVGAVHEILSAVGEMGPVARGRLIESLCSGTDGVAERRDEILSVLSWLIEKGHIIEFVDGMLLLPGVSPESGGRAVRAKTGGSRGQPSKKRGKAR